MKLAGNIAAPVIAGLAAPGLIPAGIGGAVGAGALQAFGESEADNLGDVALDTGLGAGMGLLAGGAGKVISKAPAVLSRGVSVVDDFLSPVTSKIGQGVGWLADKASKYGDFTEAAGEGIRKRAFAELGDKFGESSIPNVLKQAEGSLVKNSPFSGAWAPKGASAAASVATPAGKGIGARLADTYLGKNEAGWLGAGIQGAKILGEPIMEKVGSPVLQKLVEGANALGPYGKVLMEAMTRGPGAAATTDYLLQQSSPEYREMRTRALGVEISE